MSENVEQSVWESGTAPVSVVMISLNEGHNMEAVLENLKGWAQEVFLVDSYSKDDTVDIALRYGIHVVQRKFRDFGDQWNFALRELPITASWTMKLDPDERLSDVLKANLIAAMRQNEAGLTLTRRLWFMEHPLPIQQVILRVWPTGHCRFTDVLVNEHPLVELPVRHVDGDFAHHDSPDLEHWLEKQNRYTTAEAIILYRKMALADEPKLFGTRLQRRMWLKRHFHRLPLRFTLLFLYYLLGECTWRAGWVGFAWARLRADVMRFREYKHQEMLLTHRLPVNRVYGPGAPDLRVQQYE